ncbi:MAG: hypothetical protein ACREJV_11435 [Candidatus Rokuibacteriota bacterium]
MRPRDRAANAARRIEALPEDVRPEEIRTDLDPTTGETLASASARAVAQLRAVLQARAEQRRLPVLLKDAQGTA